MDRDFLDPRVLPDSVDLLAQVGLELGEGVEGEIDVRARLLHE